MTKTLITALFISFITITFSSCEDSTMTPDKNQGNVSFWTDTRPTNGIKIYVDGVLEGEITTFFPMDRPGCGESGTVTLYLEDGVYDYVAYQRDYYRWEGTINIKNGGCTMHLFD